MGSNKCFKSLSFVPFSTDESFINNESDPDENICHIFQDNYKDMSQQESRFHFVFTTTNGQDVS